MIGRAASGGAPKPPRATCSQPEPRGARRRMALARRRRAPTGSDQSNEDGAKGELPSRKGKHSRTNTSRQPDFPRFFRVEPEDRQKRMKAGKKWIFSFSRLYFPSFFSFGSDSIFTVLHRIAHNSRVRHLPDFPQWPVRTAWNRPLWEI